MEEAIQIARVIVNAAREHHFLGEGPLAQIPELAEDEKKLFLRMFETLRRERERSGNPSLTPEEIASLFSFVTARAAEAVTQYVNRQPWEPEMLGMLDGKIPFYVDDELGGWLRELNWPGIAGAAFLDSDSGADPLLALFEALKWTWRIAQHLVIEHLEARGVALG